jgi:hypothetical protein
MNTREIERFINRDRVCRTSFQGVFSRDTLPSKPRLLICNTDPSDKPGQHWIAIYVDKTCAVNFSIRSDATPTHISKDI